MALMGVYVARYFEAEFLYAAADARIDIAVKDNVVAARAKERIAAIDDSDRNIFNGSVSPTVTSWRVRPRIDRASRISTHEQDGDLGRLQRPSGT